MISLRSNGAHRRGTILIVIAGLSALLAALALTFMARNRSDAEETQATMQDVQARIMLVAACNYIQECSRIGWDRYPKLPTDPKPSSPPLPTETNDVFPSGATGSGQTVDVHEEAYGWLDVRDGTIGPRNANPDTAVTPADPLPHSFRACFNATPMLSDGIRTRPYWPAVDGIARCPMFVWQQPPYATQLTACYNPINADPTQTAAADYLWPYLRKPDPQPVGSKGENGNFGGAAARDTAWKNFVKGDPSVRVQTASKSWFRVLRDGPVTFLITCGAGATQGFRTFKEVSDQGQGAIFNNDAQLFQDLQQTEIRLWYRVEWSASSAEGTYHWELHHATTQGGLNGGNSYGWDSYMQWPLNASHSWAYGCRSPSFDRNMGGTFRWIERLVYEPTNW